MDEFAQKNFDKLCDLILLKRLDTDSDKTVLVKLTEQIRIIKELLNDSTIPELLKNELLQTEQIKLVQGNQYVN